jgi:UDP-N-acetylglucosamine acyltransferase
MNQINNTAYIAKSVKLGDGNLISHNVVIEGDVIIGNNNIIGPGTYITNNVSIGDNNIFTGLSSIGLEGEMGTKGDILDLSKRVIIGNGNKIREFVTIHSPVRRDVTQINNNCYIMSRAHVAHDCVLESNVVLATNSILGGGAYVEQFAYVGLGSITHQWLEIGKYSMIGMNAVNTKSVIPFTTVAGIPSRIISLNAIGAKRNGFESDLKEIEQSGISINELFETSLNMPNNRIVTSIQRFCEKNNNSNKKIK